jgi:hypothetical protein
MSIRQKSLGNLIDELTVVNSRIWHLMDEEIAFQKSDNYEEAGKKGEQVLKNNKIRGELIRAIDEIAGEKFSVSEKNY